MTDDHYNKPTQGAQDWDVPLNENFGDLGIEVANEVAIWSDLPEQSNVTQSSDGQWPVYRVAQDNVFVKVTDSSTEIVGGRGSSDHPLPSARTESVGFSGSETRVRTVGPHSGNNYQSLAAAFDDITDASRTNHYTLELTGDLIGTDAETAIVEPKSHINVAGNGYRIELDSDTNDHGVRAYGSRDCKWRNIVLDHVSTMNAQGNKALQFGKSTEPDCVFENVVAIGQNNAKRGSGIGAFDDSQPTLINCVGIGGDGGDGSSGFGIGHGASPKIEGGVFYGGNGGTNCNGVALGNGSPAPTFNNVTGIGGQTSPKNYGFAIRDGAAPTMESCVGRYKIYTQFLSSAGTDSDVVDGIDDNYPFNNYENEAVTTGWPSVLLGVSIRIINAVSGATLDIGTTSGGSEIASGIDASTTHRVAPDYTRQRFTSGDEIYVTPSDEAVDYNLRYELAVDHNTSGLLLDTKGEASISGGQFLSGTRAGAAEIGQKATDAKRYSIGNATFRPVDDSNQVGITGTPDSEATDPIRNCAIFGGYINLTPAQER